MTSQSRCAGCDRPLTYAGDAYCESCAEEIVEYEDTFNEAQETAWEIFDAR